jgi:hypothetical protein
VYEDSVDRAGRRQIKARFLIKAAPGFSYDYYCDHLYDESEGSLSWTLDSSKQNDFESIIGKWYVTEHPTLINCSLVAYSADLVLKGYVPAFITSILQKTALKSAVSWVKKFSESQWRVVSPVGVSVKPGSIPHASLKSRQTKSFINNKPLVLTAAVVASTGAMCFKSNGWLKKRGCCDSCDGGKCRSCRGCEEQH